MKRILLIDDDENFRRTTAALLAKNEFEVLQAGDGEAGLRMAKEQAPELVLSDVQMWGMDGFSLLDCLRADPATNMIPIILFSGMDDERNVRRGMGHGADDFLFKPFVPETLLATIHARLKQQRVIQQKLKQQQHILLETLSACREMTAIFTAGDYRLTYLNLAGRNMLGLAAEAEIDHCRLTDFCPANGPAWPDFSASATGHWFGELKFQRKGAEQVLVSAHVLAHRSPEGQVSHFSILASDITARRQNEESLLLHDSALENAASGIVITDNQGAIIWVNAAFRELTGYVSEEVLGKKPSLFKSGAHDDAFYEEMWGTILEGRTWRGEIVNRRKDGTLYYEESSISPVRNSEGQIQNFIAIKQDISKRKNLEKTLAQERDLLQSLMDNIPDCIYFKDARSQYTRVNLAQARRLGIKDPAEAIGRTNAAFYPIHFTRQTFVEEQCLMATGEPILNKVEEFDLPGGKVWMSTSKVPIRDWSGRIVGLVGVSRDITHLMLTEQQLQHERDLMRALMAGSPDNIYFKDRQSRFISCSHMMIERFGLPSPEDVVGKSDADFFDEKHARDAYADEQKIIQTGQPIINKVESELWRNTRQQRWVLSNKMPLRDKDGHIIGTFGISKDITDMQNAEAERRNMEVQLRQAQKLEAVGQLAAGIAHEINTPTQYVGDNTRFLKEAFESVMKVMRNHLELLAAAKRNELTPELVRQAEGMLAESDFDYMTLQIPSAINENLEGIERVTKIVRAMKEFSHPGGKDKQPADLNKAIESTVTVARNEWKYVAELKLDLEARLPFVPCFVNEFNQVILNLVVNAAHAIQDVPDRGATGKGLITIQTRQVADMVEIRVSDTGTGIAEAHRAHIFEPFFTTKEVGKGTGQGLSIIYSSVVKKHGGAVRFETETGKGTTFIVQLPIAAKCASIEEAKDQSIIAKA